MKDKVMDALQRFSKAMFIRCFRYGSAAPVRHKIKKLQSKQIKEKNVWGQNRLQNQNRAEVFLGKHAVHPVFIVNRKRI